MELGNFFVTIYLAYLIIYLFSFLQPKNRIKQKTLNTKLEDYRSIPIKTLEQQKEFLALRYPKNIQKWTGKRIFKFIFRISILIFLIQVLNKLLIIMNISFKLWQGLLFIIIFPMLVNAMLRKANLHTNDLSVFFR